MLGYSDGVSKYGFAHVKGLRGIKDVPETMKYFKLLADSDELYNNEIAPKEFSGRKNHPKQ
jgi:hypothetical protein